MPTSPSLPTPTAPPRLARRTLAGIVAVAATLLLFAGPIAQFADYHAFADRRPLWGVANAGDVLSNLPFLLVGMVAWHRQTGVAWRAFAVAVACTAFGSAAYHLAPHDFALVFDRLPIAWACGALAVAFLAERVDARFASPALLAAAFAAASGSVAWWWLGGDLRPYLFVQFLPMLLVVATFGLGLEAADRRPRGALRPSAWGWAIVLYAVAKAFELADHAVYDALGIVSGHTLKHLVAAAGAAVLLFGGGTDGAGLRSDSRR